MECGPGVIVVHLSMQCSKEIFVKGPCLVGYSRLDCLFVIECKLRKAIFEPSHWVKNGVLLKGSELHFKSVVLGLP